MHWMAPSRLVAVGPYNESSLRQGVELNTTTPAPAIPRANAGRQSLVHCTLDMTWEEVIALR